MAQLGHRLDNLVHLIRQDQPRQMQHGTDANARPEIGWARRQIAVRSIKRILQLLL